MPNLSKLKEQMTEKLQAAKENEARRADKLNGLFQSEGYRYLQTIAAEIEAEYTCKPTDPNWQTFTTIGYAFGSLFSRVMKEARKGQQAAPRTSILEEIQNNARNSNSRRDNSDPGSPGPYFGGR